MHGEEPLSSSHGIQGHGSQVRMLSQHEKTVIISLSSQVADDSLAERESFTNGRNAQSICHPVLGSEDSYMLSAGQTLNNDTDLRNDRKRKVSSLVEYVSYIVYFFP